MAIPYQATAAALYAQWKRLSPVRDNPASALLPPARSFSIPSPLKMDTSETAATLPAKGQGALPALQVRPRFAWATTPATVISGQLYHSIHPKFPQGR